MTCEASQGGVEETEHACSKKNRQLVGVWEKLHSENMCGTRKYPHDKLSHTQTHNKERHSLTSHNNAAGPVSHRGYTAGHLP